MLPEQGLSHSNISLQTLLEDVAKGQISVKIALEKLQQLSLEPFDAVEDFAKIDRLRQQRTGFPEVIWGENKTAPQIAKIIAKMREYSPVVMATRIDEAKYLEIKKSIPDLKYHPQARIIALLAPNSLVPSPSTITILTAGTADLPIAEEAAVTAELWGFQVQKLWDVGVAGIQRLLSHRHILDRAEVIIVVAGMEGALVSVVAGMVRCPVIAVPTSIGYGASFGGVAALLTMLNSCAAGVGVVNIDNGFGAAILAGKMLLTKPQETENIEINVPSYEANLTSIASPHWQLVYSQDADGQAIEGTITCLLTAVRQGQQIKIAIDFLEGREYIIQVDELWIKNDIVYACCQTQMGIDFRGDLMISNKKGDRLSLIASTQGDLEITRLSISTRKIKGRSHHRVGINWFVR
jgi:pyridinium-3,5-biscarboxylic acid mononucleotide synthase